MPGEKFSPSFEAVDAERASIDSRPVSYEVHTDGTTIYAEPQISGSSRVTGTDIQNVLETVVIDEIPPRGNHAEAFGKIRFKAHDGFYPGTLNEFKGILSGVSYVGETSTHSLPDESSGGSQRPSQPGVAFKTDATGDNAAFRCPNTADVSDSNDFPINMTYFRDLSIIGTGPTDGTAINYQSTDGNVGHCYARNLFIQELKNPFLVPFAGIDTPMRFDNIHALRWQGELQVRRNGYLTNSAVNPGNGGRIKCDGGNVLNCSVHGIGEAQHTAQALNGARFVDLSFRKIGGTDGSGVACQVSGGSVARGLKFHGSSLDFSTKIQLSTNGVVEGGLYDTQSTGTSVVMIGDDPDVRLTKEPTNGISNSATRGRWNGIIGGGPLGGVDLSSTTGQFTGDRAIADGTSTADAGDMARWNGSAWDVFQPATTV